MRLDDKRKYPRAECQISSSFTAPDENGRSSLRETTVSDISEGGIRFRTARFIPVRDRLPFNLNPPKRKSTETLVKPAWVTELPHLGQYEIGASFLTLSREDQNLIREMLASPSPIAGPVFGWLDK